MDTDSFILSFREGNIDMDLSNLEPPSKLIKKFQVNSNILNNRSVHRPVTKDM